MRGDGEEEWGRDAESRGGTRSSSSPSAGRGWLNPALSHPYSAPAQPQLCQGWFGEGRGDGAALARRKPALEFRGKRRSMLLVRHHPICRQTGGWGRKEATSQQCLLQPHAVGPASPGIQPLHSHRVSGHPTATGGPSSSSRQTPAGSGIAPCKESACSC